MDTDRVTDQLHDLPPDLRDPVDRFEQIRERVRRRRRRQAVVGGAAGAVVLALAVPLATQLLPDEPAIAPGSATALEEDLLGGTRVTPLSEPRTVTGTGTATVELGEPPAESTGVDIVLDCLGPGTFEYPDGAGMICSEEDGEELGRQSQAGYVVALADGQKSVEIRATDGARWRVTTTYVSTEVTEWGVNAKGETFGVHNENGEPDLVTVIATNGQIGYAYVAEMNAAGGPAPSSPEEALVQQQERLGKTFSVPVYESDGETVIGELVIGGSDDPAVLADTATVTRGP
ncbi:peptidase M56 family protein [Ornithinimicrobium cryptoxanthini]|uniref:Peptidase M56 family protein n=1 Tax=Ornithinimicrobium cryptoxanthini TaxID=2934161 RepID=A0ABY4YM53_9MICO|nr:peptidase M56 family protein [Ornithinimicrobium cryptoxanthini]USQ77433.1 peptidase M56 family protein [Ornithinimicrobium cryptoxanthini]